MINRCDIVELKQKIDAQENFQFIDCREKGEWEEVRIAQATLLPLSEFDKNFQNILKDKNAPIIIHCRSGKRSMNACVFLLNQGYTNLTNVEGGILDWMEEGLPVIKG